MMCIRTYSSLHVMQDQGGPVSQCRVSSPHSSECRDELHSAHSLQAQKEGAASYIVAGNRVEYITGVHGCTGAV